MEIGGVEFSGKCPEKCPFKDDIANYGQGAVCIRCPIFNCAGDFTLLNPEKYRHDWALVWRKWFDTGMRGLPELLLERSE